MNRAAALSQRFRRSENHAVSRHCFGFRLGSCSQPAVPAQSSGGFDFSSSKLIPRRAIEFHLQFELLVQPFRVEVCQLDHFGETATAWKKQKEVIEARK